MPLHTVDVKTLKHWLDHHTVTLIDVREPEEYESESIPGSQLIPLAQVSNDQLPVHAENKLVIHCRSGKRSTDACHRLLKEDPSLIVYNLEGGILAWIQAGYPVHSER
jgi:rhodanese-related sulfurtransferase